MLSNAIIVIPFNLPWNWSTDYYNQTAEILSKHGNTVICFLWQDALSIKEYIQKRIWPKIFFEKKSQLYIYQPIHLIPFRRFNIITRINLYLNAQVVKLSIFLIDLGKQKKRILWIFDPEYYLLLKIFGKQYKSVYDCVDYYSASSFNLDKKIYIIKNERKLLLESDFVFVISNQLYKRHSRIRSDTRIVSQGFRLEEFRVYSYLKNPNIKEHKVIGYIGGINDRFDYKLLIKIAKLLPDVHFVFCGPKQFIPGEQSYYEEIYLSKLFNLPNVEYINHMQKNKIPELIATFSISIIPYKNSTKFNLYSYPMKLFEYFYMGKPVISTPIEELKRFPKFVKIASTAGEWEKCIKDLLASPWPKSYQREQRKLAIANSWEKKIAAISREIMTNCNSN